MVSLHPLSPSQKILGECRNDYIVSKTKRVIAYFVAYLNIRANAEYDYMVRASDSHQKALVRTQLSGGRRSPGR
jgi:hypothetical protein